MVKESKAEKEIRLTLDDVQSKRNMFNQQKTEQRQLCFDIYSSIHPHLQKATSLELMTCIFALGPRQGVCVSSGWVRTLPL